MLDKQYSNVWSTLSVSVILCTRTPEALLMEKDSSLEYDMLCFRIFT